MKPNIQIGDIIWSESYKSLGLILEEYVYPSYTPDGYVSEAKDYYVFIFDDTQLNTYKLKPKDNIVIHNEGLYGKTWWIKGKEYGL